MLERLMPPSGGNFSFEIRNHSRWYTEQKKYKENVLKRSLARELDYVETSPFRSLPPHLTESLVYVQKQLKHIQQREIDGYRIRTRSIPNFEVRKKVY